MKFNLLSSLKIPFTLIFVVVTSLLSSCKTEGCTDPKANNFSYEAEKDDGSCDYGGCMDPNSLNYDPHAKYDNGTCRYNGDLKIFTSRTFASPQTFISVLIGSEYIGSLSNTCNDSPITCTTNCASLNFTEKTEGTYTLQFFEIQQFSSTNFDTIYESSRIAVNITGGQCNTYTIE